MAIDPYALCPGGTGKKLKFCCPDLLSELEKIERMLAGDQRLACLEHIQQLEAKHPGRACLLTTKAMLLSELGRADEAETAIQTVLREQPANPVALAESALITASQKGATASIELLQSALAATPSEMPSQVYTALATIAQLLVAEGQIAAARGHLLLLAGLTPNDERTMTLLGRLNGAPSVPLLLKETPEFADCPSDAPWKADLEAALEPVRRGAWRVAVDKLAALAARVQDAPAIWWNLATLRMWLADNDGAATALRRFAALDVPLDKAVEAEALAQVLSPTPVTDRVDVLRLEYPVLDIEQLTTALLSDRRLSPIPIDPAPWREENLPPPKHAFQILDRPLPATADGLTRDMVPNNLGRAMLFGRETDREARLELVANRLDLPAVREYVAGVARSTLGPEAKEEVVGSLGERHRMFSIDWRLPDEVSPDRAHELLVEQQRHTLLETWPKSSSSLLGGRTPEEAAGDPSQKIPLLAAILVLELSVSDAALDDCYDALRKRLGLPAAEPIDPTGTSIEDVRLARLARLQLDKLSDDDLLVAYRHAMFSSAKRAARKIALEIIRRPSLDEKLDKSDAYEALAELEDDARQALVYLDRSREMARAKGKSCVRADLAELTMRLERGEAEAFARVLQHVQAEHGREPGVSRVLVQILTEAGLIGPDGRPAASRQQAEAPAIVVPGAAAEPGKIWTPGSEAPQGKKSALWTPGMD